MLTEPTFCRNSSINISIDNRYTIDLFTSEDRYLPWITTATVFTLPTTLGIAHARVTLARRRSPYLRTGCRIIATQQLDSLTVPSTPYVFNNCIYFLSYLLAGTNIIAIDLIAMKDFFLSIGPQQSAISSRWGAVITGDCAMTLTFHVLQKICNIKISLQFISTFGRDIPLPL